MDSSSKFHFHDHDNLTSFVIKNLNFVRISGGSLLSPGMNYHRALSRSMMYPGMGYPSGGFLTDIVDRDRMNKTSGFEGCINFEKGCEFGGYYLCTYSKEGLCKQCEIKQFPERFHGCLFCRGALPLILYICLDCNAGFKNWVQEHTNIHDGEAAIHHGQAAFRLMEEKSEEDMDFISTKTCNSWPGFYLGDKKWIIPDINLVTKEEIGWDNCHDVLRKLLKENGIDIHADVQYTDLT